VKGLGFGLLVAAFWLGFRHGIDWDHIAAITDITSSQDDRRRAIFFGTLYAVGHAAVVFALGIVAILFGRFIPQAIEGVMGKIVGVTLLVLGVYVFVSLIRHGRDFRLRSRWMLVFAGARKAGRWVKEKVETTVGNGGDAERSRDALLRHHGHHGRRGHHHHDELERDEHGVQNYGRGTAFGVGMIHGVGAETPTQVLIFISAANANETVGILVLIAFLVGLLLSNSIITIGSAFGFLQAERNFALYATVAVLAGTFSLVLGLIFVLGKESILPAFFGG
jgi:high-affinity nickel-transport protein